MERGPCNLTRAQDRHIYANLEEPSVAPRIDAEAVSRIAFVIGLAILAISLVMMAALNAG